MATIGSLKVQLSLGTAMFSKGIDVAAAGFNKLSSAAASMGKSIAGFAVKGASSIAGLAVQLVQWGADSAVALGKTSRELGATAAGLAELQHAAKLLGGSNEDVAGALQSLNGALSQAAFGSTALNDVFKRLGLNVGQLAKMPVDQAFYKIAAAIGAINDPTQRAAAASQIFGASAGKILPLLRQGQAGLAKFAEEARRMGLALSDQQASAAEDAYVISNLREACEGLARQLAVQLAPWINATVTELGKMAGTGGDAAKSVSSGFRNVAKAIAWLVDAFQPVHVGFKLMELGIRGIMFAAVKSIQKILDAASYLPEALGGGKAEKGAAVFKKFSDDALSGIHETKAEIDALLESISNKPLATQQVDRFFDNVQKNMAALDKSRLQAKTGGGSVGAAARNGGQFAASLDVINAAKTPLEQFNEQLVRNSQLLASGAISFDTYARSAGNAVAQLEKAHGLSDIRMAGAVAGNTSAAYSATIQAQKEGDVKNRESPQERLTRVMNESKNIEQKQLEYLREIARAMQQDPAVRAILP